MNPIDSPPFHARQNGAVLITGMIFLVVLMMLAVTSTRMTSLEERMSGNMRDRNVALQAAELALRDAEQDIRGIGTTPRSPTINGIAHFSAVCNEDGATNTSDDGLCDRRGGTPTYSINSITWLAYTALAVNYAALTVDMTATPSIAYGRFTGATAIPGLSAQPRYLIDGIKKTPPGGGTASYYRITVRAQGANANTVVWLQEVFRKP
jgi:type IV pilus assembly protein PilX